MTNPKELEKLIESGCEMLDNLFREAANLEKIQTQMFRGFQLTRVVPTWKQLEALQSFRSSFERLIDLLEDDLSDILAETGHPWPECPGSLHDIRSCLEEARLQLNHLRQNSREVKAIARMLKYVEYLEDPEEPVSEEILRIRKEATQLREKVEGGLLQLVDKEREALLERNHPLLRLYQLISPDEEVEDSAFLEIVFELHSAKAFSAQFLRKLSGKNLQCNPQARRQEKQNETTEAETGRKTHSNKNLAGSLPLESGRPGARWIQAGRSKAARQSAKGSASKPGEKSVLDDSLRTKVEGATKSEYPGVDQAEGSADSVEQNVLEQTHVVLEERLPTQAEEPDKCKPSGLGETEKNADSAQKNAFGQTHAEVPEAQEIAFDSVTHSEKNALREDTSATSMPPLLPNVETAPMIVDDMEVVEDLSSETKESSATEPCTVLGDALSSVETNLRQMLTNNESLTPEITFDCLQSHIWHLLYCQREDLAYHLSVHCHEKFPEQKTALFPWILRALLLSSHVRNPGGKIAGLLKNDFASFKLEDCFLEANVGWNHAIRLILAAVSIRPTILAPTTEASVVLRNLRMKDGLGKLFEYCQKIAAFGEHHYNFDPNLLRSTRSQAAWEKENQAKQEEIKNWHSQAPMLTMAFAGATKVWRTWLDPNQLISNLMDPILKNDTSKIAWLKSECIRLKNDALLQREVKKTDRIKRRGKRIEGTSYAQLQKKVDDAIRLVNDWILLQESHPERNNSFLRQQVEELRTYISSNHKFIVEEVEAFQRQHEDSPFVRVGADLCLRGLKDVRQLFDPSTPWDPIEVDPNCLLHAELLHIPNVKFDEDWNPNTDYESFVHDVTELVNKRDVSWQQSFEQRSLEDDHTGTGLILELFELRSLQGVAMEKMQEQREQALQECRERLRRNLEEARQNVGEAVALGLLREEDRSSYSSRLEAIEMKLPNMLTFAEGQNALKEIKNELQGEKEQSVQRLRTQLVELSLDSQSDEYKRILTVLEQGDVLAANELIEMVRKHEPLPEPTSTFDVLQDFFPETAAKLMDYAQSNSASRMLANLRGRRGFATLNLGPLTGSHASGAASMLEAWFTLKRMEQLENGLLKTLLSELGFVIQSLSLNSSLSQSQRRKAWVDLKSDILKDREICPLPFYGSEARGLYRVLCLWGRPTEEEIIQHVGETLHGQPVIVLFFGQLSERRRRELARCCRTRRRTFVVLDELLLLYLCGVRGLRLPVFFACALPFTYSKAYQITASLVPPEMFYGRQKEKEIILDPLGSCFLYGGRQLGKTALLRDVRRSFHRPEQHRIALWIDLKAEGIGYNRSIDEIWSLLTAELKKVEVIPKNTPVHTKPDKICEHIESWIHENQERRVLLLLDEADRFLESDGKDSFIHASRIKNLMERTNRRVKVVFAGLHNVQRTITHQVNNPNSSLPHYGTPICIGPLLEQGEWKEAQALIEKPMASMGFRFESTDLVIRILSQTNYFPSLIQIYGHELHQHVTQPNIEVFNAKASPPFVITREHVERAYKSQELRNTIKQRFNLTLELDKRYEVIAYSIAYSIVSERGEGMVTGFSVDWIRDQALSWWSEGFKNSNSVDAIRSLVDEMVGLGILRLLQDSASGNGHYTLRSPNVVLLLGTESEIETILLRHREPPMEYEPASFRSALRTPQGEVDVTRRSPLTAQQESQLRRTNGVSIFFGSAASGLGDMQPFLRSSFGNEYFIPTPSSFQLHDFRKHLQHLKSRKTDGTTLLYVPSQCLWNMQWVKDAQEHISRLRSERSFVRVVFESDPSHSWQIVGRFSSTEQDWLREQITIFSLQPWSDYALRQWLEGCEVVPCPLEDRKMLYQSLGNWPILLSQFYKYLKERSHHPHMEWTSALKTFYSEHQQPEAAATFLKHAGVEQGLRYRVLHGLAEYGGQAPFDELSELLEDVTPEDLRRCLTWADHLQLVSLEGNDSWCLDPVVKGAILTPSVD